MPKINFDEVEDKGSYSPLPDGKYKVRVEDCQDGVSNNGNPKWDITHVIIEGEYAGRKIWDCVTLTKNAMWRVKLVCSRLGLNTKGEVDVEPLHLVGKSAIVTVIETEYKATSGETKKKSQVVADGYEAIEVAEGESKSDNDDDDLPF